MRFSFVWSLVSGASPSVMLDHKYMYAEQHILSSEECRAPKLIRFLSPIKINTHHRCFNTFSVCLLCVFITIIMWSIITYFFSSFAGLLFVKWEMRWIDGWNTIIIIIERVYMNEWAVFKATPLIVFFLECEFRSVYIIEWLLVKYRCIMFDWMRLNFEFAVQLLYFGGFIKINSV